MIIEESGMRFGEYPDSKVFYIEKSPQYQIHLMPNGVKTCEFILLRNLSLCFIEAKKSCPNQIAEDTAEEKIKKYNEYIDDIITKMRHSLDLYASILLERHSAEGVSQEMLENKLSGQDADINMILVVKDAEKEWLASLKEKLEKELGRERRIWKAQLFVINEEQARKKRLVM